MDISGLNKLGIILPNKWLKKGPINLNISLILYIVSAAVVPVLLSESVGSQLKEYLAWGLIALCYGGELLALIIATRKVFFKPKNSENK